MRVAIIFCALLCACASTQKNVQSFASTSAIALDEADVEITKEFHRVHNYLRGQVASLEEYDQKIEGFRDAARAMSVVRSSLFALQGAIDAWNAGGKNEWPALVACVISSMRDTSAALAQAGAQLPNLFASAIESGVNLIGDKQCK